MRGLVTILQGPILKVLSNIVSGHWGLHVTKFANPCLVPSGTVNWCYYLFCCQWWHSGAWISEDPFILDLSVTWSHQILSLWLNVFLSSATPSYFPESHRWSEISSLSKVILVLQKPEVPGCQIWAIEGLSQLVDLMFHQKVLHEMWYMSRHVVVVKLPITRLQGTPSCQHFTS